MELVRGIPITEYCDQNQLTPRERLELFVSVCQAIQHAHQKGVIHRDIKPSNVLVTSHDGKPVAKVIDFGVAKAIHQQLTDRTIYTQFAQMIGTPLYMSPEQAEMSGLDIDTRSDIYSLGVLLYELLTGTTPLKRKSLAAVAYDEIRRLIREEEPPKPSQRLSTSDTLPSVAACRKMEPAKLTRMMRGELDWIVMKALEKDRTRRYETASGLAQDVQRYLADELVEARPPSAGYRLRKFARKNRAALTTAAAMVLLLLAGVAASLWQAQKARAAAEAEKQAKETAEDREAETQAVLDFVETRIIAPARPEGQEGGLGRDVMLRRAIEEALKHVETSFRNQPLIEARLRVTLGKSFYYLGEEKVASDQFQAARTIYTLHRGPDHPDTLTCMHELVMIIAHANRAREALELCKETVRLREGKLGRNHQDTLSSRILLACMHRHIGQYDIALTLDEETLKLCQETLGSDHPQTLCCMSGLGDGYTCLGRDGEALKVFQKVLDVQKAKLGPNDPETLNTMTHVAGCYWALDQYAECIPLCNQLLRVREKVLGPEHRTTLWLMANFAEILATAPDKSLRDAPRALALAKKAVEMSPDPLVFLGTRGIAYYQNYCWKEAKEDLEQACNLRKLEIPENFWNQAANGFFLAMAHWQLGKKDEARAEYRNAEHWMKKLGKADVRLKRFQTEAARLLELEKKDQALTGQPGG
jgi:tetratricopeptide (TPR) repeat protein